MPALLASYIVVAVGGAAGAMARYGLTGLTYNAQGSIPLGTLASNLLGCFFMGIIAELVATSSWFDGAGTFPEHYRLLFAVGFCGAFTTLSSLVFEINGMMQRDQFATAFTYMFGTLAGGFACFYAGAMLARMYVNAQ